MSRKCACCGVVENCLFRDSAAVRRLQRMLSQQRFTEDGIDLIGEAMRQSFVSVYITDLFIAIRFLFFFSLQFSITHYRRSFYRVYLFDSPVRNIILNLFSTFILKKELKNIYLLCRVYTMVTILFIEPLSNVYCSVDQAYLCLIEKLPQKSRLFSRC